MRSRNFNKRRLFVCYNYEMPLNLPDHNRWFIHCSTNSVDEADGMRLSFSGATPSYENLGNEPTTQMLVVDDRKGTASVRDVLGFRNQTALNCHCCFRRTCCDCRTCCATGDYRSGNLVLLALTTNSKSNEQIPSKSPDGSDCTDPRQMENASHLGIPSVLQNDQGVCRRSGGDCRDKTQQDAAKTTDTTESESKPKYNADTIANANESEGQSMTTILLESNHTSIVEIDVPRNRRVKFYVEANREIDIIITNEDGKQAYFEGANNFWRLTGKRQRVEWTDTVEFSSREVHYLLLINQDKKQFRAVHYEFFM